MPRLKLKIFQASPNDKTTKRQYRDWHCRSCRYFSRAFFTVFLPLLIHETPRFRLQSDPGKTETTLLIRRATKIRGDISQAWQLRAIARAVLLIEVRKCRFPACASPLTHPFATDRSDISLRIAVLRTESPLGKGPVAGLRIPRQFEVDFPYFLKNFTLPPRPVEKKIDGFRHLLSLYCLLSFTDLLISAADAAVNPERKRLGLS